MSKAKIGPDEQSQAIGVLKMGGSLRDAADILGVNYKTLYRARKADLHFATRIVQAAAAGKLRLMQRIFDAKQWQAAAWMLERKYGKEYGRKDRIEDHAVSRRVTLAFVPDRQLPTG